ncbi:MAG: hypothetical protein DRP86_05015 [Candidatus Neomarinimicrobiota bacterium]|nr:hypothetical protein [Candidatus Neomarinimicrobiota bacterium]RKY49594.1 MAG: hypothetical protein DRP86_05015 [Candidatus Neomarinimicrobiota bacterium]
MEKIGILKYPGASGDHDLYWAVRNCCGQKAVFLESGNWNPDEISALLIPGGLYVPGYSDVKDSHLIAHVIRNYKPVLAIAEGYYFIKASQGLTADLIPLKDKKRPSAGSSIITDNTNFWLTRYDINEEVSWPESYRFHSFSRDDTINSIVVSKADERILGVGFKKYPVAAFLLHPERVVDEVIGDISGANLFNVLRTDQ